MKRFWTTLFTLVLVVAFAFPVQAAWKDMHATVYKWTGGYNQDGSPGLTRITSGITFKVLQRGQNDTRETLYKFNDNYFTSLTNPVSATNFASASYCAGEIKFRVDPTESNDRYVDVLVVDTAGGYSVTVQDFDVYTHTIVIDERPNVIHHGKIWWDGTTTDVTSAGGVYFLAGQQIHGMQVEVTTVLAAESISVGAALTASWPEYIKGETMATAGVIASSATSSGHRLVRQTTAWASDFIPNGYTIAATASTEALYFRCYSNGGTNSGLTPYGFIHYYFSTARRY